jgi:hypothetical protein
MAAAGVEIKNIIYAFIAVLVGVLLVPVINSACVTANVTGTLAIVLSIVPLLFTLGILLVAIRTMAM